MKKITIRKKIHIQKLFDISNLFNGSLKEDKEYVSCSIKVKNNTGYEIPNNIIRHKTYKEKWLLKTNSRHVVFTCDHSLIKFIDDSLYIEVKPNEIKPGDLVKVNDKLEKVTYIKNIGNFENEYVYDVEMQNDNTFYANDILVHNTDSCYISLEDVIDDLKSRKLIPPKYEKDNIQLILDIYEQRLEGYINKAYDAFAKKYNTTNIQKFELEAILYNVIFLRKKKYAGELGWKEGTGKIEKGKKLKITGIEIVQSSTPGFARDKLKKLVQYIFDHIETFSINDFIKELNKIKQEFKVQDIEFISMSSSIGDYEKSILEDKNELKVASGCPIHVRGAGYHNFLLNQSKEYGNKYKRIKTGDKVKMYHCKDDFCNVFCFNSGNYPYEIAPEIDMDLQFEKVIIDPINRFIVAMGNAPIRPTLISTKSLF